MLQSRVAQLLQELVCVDVLDHLVIGLNARQPRALAKEFSALQACDGCARQAAALLLQEHVFQQAMQQPDMAERFSTLLPGVRQAAAALPGGASAEAVSGAAVAAAVQAADTYEQAAPLLVRVMQLQKDERVYLQVRAA